MRWWKSDKKRDPPNPPNPRDPRKLTRVPKLRHLSDVEIGNLKFKKEEELKRTSVSSYNGEVISPLPLPVPQNDEGGLRMSISSLGFVSPRDEVNGARGSDARSSSASSSIFYTSRIEPASETSPRTQKTAPFFRSPPTSVFSSPGRSPYRHGSVSNSAPATPYTNFVHVWSAPELPPYEHRSSNFNANSSGNDSPVVHPLPLPPEVQLTVEGQWQKRKLIGSGTYGNVYEGTNRLTGALCAMKEVVLVNDDSKSLECSKQLKQEIEFLSQFKHENIVQYYGSEIIGDQFYIYLEYVHPGSINKYVQQHSGVMTESMIRNFTRHILNGLAYLHSMNIMHRDIKGANLLVDAKGVVKLADFGMAKHLSGLAPNLSLKGTPYWMAPEVVQATMNAEVGYDTAVDIWSLGCTIIEMFTGKHPWEGLEGAAAMFKVMHTDPQIPKELSPEGTDFLHLCFKRNPAERPTACALLEHPFIKNLKHYNMHGSIQAFAGLKIQDKSKGRERSNTFTSDPNARKKPLSHGGSDHLASVIPPLPRSSPEALRRPLAPPLSSFPRSPNGSHPLHQEPM
ncbi:mitogen-activated protein kinase kinase kinase 5-like isoform X2 [Carex rostrata]